MKSNKERTETFSEETLNSILDTIPMSCSAWSEEHKLLYCNKEVLDFYKVTTKEELIEKIKTLYPQNYTDVNFTSSKLREGFVEAFKTGCFRSEWTLKNSQDNLIKTEITLKRIEIDGRYVVLYYIKDINHIMTEQAEREMERTKIMLDATPLSCQFWNKNLETIDCNLEAVRLFGLKDKNEFIEGFFKLSPEYQPDGRLSKEKAAEKINYAFTKGRIVFEWMHHKLDGELIPAEITLVPVTYQNEDMVIGYVRDLRELKDTLSTLSQVENMAFTDALTNIFNRRYLLMNADIALRNSIALNSPLSFIMFDLDRFKNINDTYGHPVGDEVLKFIVETVKGVLRKNEVFARYGGEEFIILVLDDIDSAFYLAERIRKKIDSVNFICNDTSIRVTISLGIATFNDKNETVDDIILRSDTAMYDAKNKGRNRTVLLR